MAVTLLYIDMDEGDFVVLLITSQLLFGLVTIVAWRLAVAELAPIEHWLRDARSADVWLAWRIGVRLPFALPHASRVLVTAFLSCFTWDLLATAVLGLGWTSALVLLAGSAITFLYWAMLAFLSLEHGLRPVVEDIASALPEPPPLPRRRVSLRLRLGAALPAINLITGVVVAGLFPGQGGIRDLAIGIGAALAVSVTISLWLTNLLTDSVVTPVARLREAAERVEGGDLDVRIPVTTGDETAELALAFNSMVLGLQRRERLREAFGAYVDPALAQHVEENAIDLAGEEVEATILFIDVRDFTSFAERAPAHAVVSQLNSLFECVVPIVLDHSGHANKFVGDGLMAVFGAPSREPDHAGLAVRAALAIATAVDQRDTDDLRVGIGVNSGTVVAGTLGGGGRLDFTVIGDTVNTAARVESATRQTGDTVLITEATYTLIPEILQRGFAARDTVALKGKRDRIRVFAPRL
jgi:class 3 adenylate cyclase